MTDEPQPETCALCGEPIRPGDKAMSRNIPEKGGVVRVHIICFVKIDRIRRQPG